MRKPKVYLFKKKITFILLTIVFQINTSTGIAQIDASMIYAQSSKISLNFENTSLAQAFAVIEDQTDYNFFYRNEEVDLKRKVTVRTKQVEIDGVLEMLLKGSGLIYKVLGKHIIVTKPSAAPESSLHASIGPTTIADMQTSAPDQRIITGKIKDENGQGIPGASILIQGTTIGVVSDANGDFSIEASPGDVLVISFVGYHTQNIKLDQETSIEVQLIPDLQELEEVLVIGYGTVKKSDLTGAVAQVKTESFENQPVTRVDEILQGRAAGVMVSKSNGAPGAAIKVRVRGVNSITGNNDPLIVIDGIQGGDLSTLNPNDIASIEVLKDASATAIYGVRGSNGVIMVSTKKGFGDPKVNVDYFSTISRTPELIPILSTEDFAIIENSRRIRTGGNPIFTDQDIAGFAANGGTNYQDELLRTGFSENLQVSTSGSTGKVRYFVSGNFRDEEGIVITNKYQQFSGRSNISVNATDKLNIGLNVYGSISTTHNNFESFGNGQGSPMFKALTWDPTTPVFNEDGEYNFRSILGIASLNDNPVYVLRESEFEDINERLNTALNVSWDISNSLNYTLLVGTQNVNFTRQRYRVETGDDRLPHTSFDLTKTTFYQISNILTWQKEFQEHNIKLTGVQEYSNRTVKFNGYNANDLSLPLGFYKGDILTPNSGQRVSNDFNEREISSFMLRGEYIFDDRLFLTATGRYDGTSVFRSDERWGFFPSMSLAYDLNSLLRSSPFSNFKLRAGWGQVGNQSIDPYATYALLGSNSFAFDGVSAQAGTLLTSFENAGLTWETTTQTNVGIDLSFMQGLANLSIDGYIKNTTDLLLDVPVLDVNGGGTIPRNVGEVENIGLDLSTTADIISTDDFLWNSTLTFTYQQNEVKELFGEIEEIEGRYEAPGGQGRAVNIVQEGEPIGQFFGAIFLGTWKSAEASEAANFGRAPGDAKYLRDENGDIAFGDIGNGTPTTMWGFNNTITYKNWDLNIFLQGIHGFDVFNIQQAAIVGGAGDSRSFLSPDQVNQWTPENETDIPAGVTFFNSSRYVEEGGFVRLSNAIIAYTFSNVSWLGDATLKVYAGGQNLFLITDYSGYDPESTSTRNFLDNDDVAAGINVGAYPNPRTYTIGVKVGF